jgi:hypothetical protein
VTAQEGVHSRFLSPSISAFRPFFDFNVSSSRLPHLLPSSLTTTQEMEDDSERVLLELNDQLAVQRSIAQGASNFLSVFDPDPNDRKEDLRLQILQELTAADGNIAELLARIDDVQGESASSASGVAFGAHPMLSLASYWSRECTAAKEWVQGPEREQRAGSGRAPEST